MRHSVGLFIGQKILYICRNEIRMTAITLIAKSRKKISLIESLAKELGIIVQKGKATTKAKVTNASKDAFKQVSQAQFLKGYTDADAVYDND